MKIVIRRLVQTAVNSGLALRVVRVWPKGARVAFRAFGLKGGLDGLISVYEPPRWRNGVEPEREVAWRLLIDKGRS